ncbi:ComC/BlpC family peptide pheromone/bacteriocin [Gracilimonas mengyeensis]|uniref:Bacteriocin class II with double-glycine leader peptide n=1 Tax=Gracilimonas mengyeensis TaxID=1302730 RepID=A0A521DC88_9BACT|nr:ComC/BlpC family peptide pheromone/bacteriocin [Gracilimonas mengyeensis]SMO69208.1 hypothetical protein SAMN06265219_10819 [Gracilimonas mengyeensis]
MNALEFNEMEHIQGGDVCAVVTGGAAGGGWAAAVGGAVANGAKLTWRLGVKGLVVGAVGGAIAGGVCYALS